MMRLICSGEQAISFLSGPNSLLDARLDRYELFRSGDIVNADLHFSLRPSAQIPQVVLRHEVCKEIVFSYTDDFIFYNIERVKILCVSPADFYVSLDPFDESSHISDRDGDYIRSTLLHLYEYTAE